jgi:hypothetical protein
MFLTFERYNAVEASFQSPDGLAGPSAWTAKVLEEWLMKHAAVIIPDHTINPGTDIFAQSFDR